jgi:hypothetical protein
MICPTCGREVPPHETGCPHCREGEGQVKVLTPAERENFQGVTLGDEPAEEGRERRYQYGNGGQRIYVRHVSFGGGSSLWTKLIILVVAGVAIFVVLPMFFLFFAAAGVIWFILSLLRR